MTDQAGRKVVFLDRDGVINADNGFVHKWEKWQWAPGAKKGLVILKDTPFALVVVTNQSGVGHGLYKEQDVVDLHKKLQRELGEEGLGFETIIYCPHHREAGCGCRKPKTGMAEKAEEIIGKIDYRGSWMVGDKIADLEFGKSLGTATILVRSKYWKEAEIEQRKPDKIVNSLLEAAEIIRESV